MKNKNINNAKLSWASTAWFYIALVVATLFYILLIVISVYCMLFESERESFMHAMLLLSGASGIGAVILTCKRKLWGLFLVFIPALSFALIIADGYGSTVRENDILPLTMLLFAPGVLLLSLLPTLKKLKPLGPGWGLGSMKYVNSDPMAPRWAVWLFRLVFTFSFLIQCMVFMGIIATYFEFYSRNPTQIIYSPYLYLIAGVSGLVAVLTLLKKELFGIVWSIAPCLIPALGLAGIGFGKLGKSHLQNFHGILIASIMAVFLLASQIPYLRKKLKEPGGGFKKSHFSNSASFTDEDMTALYNTRSAYSMAFVVFYIPILSYALLASQAVSRGIGGAIGNFLGVALIFGAMVCSFIMTRARKKRYVECRDRLGLTEEDVIEALMHKKQGTGTKGNL